MSSARIPPNPQSTGDTQHNVPNAAFHGASTAFGKPPVKPKPQTNTYTGSGNGALLAATKVGTGGRSSGTTTPLRNDWTGGSARSSGRPNASPRHQLSNSSSSGSLKVPEDSNMDRIPSPSNIAAKLAAARHSASKPPVQASVVPITSAREPNEVEMLPPPGSVGNVLAKLDSRKPTVKEPQKREKAATHSHPSKPRASPEDTKPTDDTPIAPTNSLVKMFEQTPSSTSPRTFSPVPFIPYNQPPVRSPKPQRKIKVPPEPRDEIPLEPQTRTPPVNPTSKPQHFIPSFTDSTQEDQSFSLLRKDTLGSPPVRRKSAQLAASKNAGPRPKPPTKKFSRQPRPKSEDLTHPSIPKQRRISSSLSNYEIPSSPISFVSAREEQEAEKPKPTLPPPRRSARQKLEAEAEVRPKTAGPLLPKPRAASKLALPVPPSQSFPAPRRNSTSGTSPAPGGVLYHNNYQRESARAITKHMTGESLSSAIVGASLASSRNASPNPARLVTPPLSIRKQQQHHHSPFHHSPSPPKPQPTGKLRTTMRKEVSSSSDEDQSDRYKRKGTRIMGMGRKHPNKHHEGTRKRWRDQVTELERKRYEGVWAANKGLHIQDTSSRSSSRTPDKDPMLDVLNLVTKDIWSRSRLPEHELEEVWDLVDGRGVGRLRRDEFVVGMWLVDQRLKGRKIPAKVSESVWGSVRGVGVKVKVRPK